MFSEGSALLSIKSPDSIPREIFTRHKSIQEKIDMAGAPLTRCPTVLRSVIGAPDANNPSLDSGAAGPGASLQVPADQSYADFVWSQAASKSERYRLPVQVVYDSLLTEYIDLRYRSVRAMKAVVDHCVSVRLHYAKLHEFSKLYASRRKSISRHPTQDLRHLAASKNGETGMGDYSAACPRIPDDCSRLTKESMFELVRQTHTRFGLSCV